MSEMGYDAMNIGNHEFDNGLDGILKQLPHAHFKMLSANYDFSNTILKGKTQPYEVFIKDDIKIGVFGLGIELEGLVGKKAYGETVYLDPQQKAAEMAYLLKKDFKCDLVICISHLGFSYRDKKISDVVLAKQSKNIDLIIGGHTHTFIDKPYVFRNSDGKEIIIAQVGWGGVKLGRIDFYMSKKFGISFADAYTQDVAPNLT
jgi:5'-nucleotidase